MTDAPTLDALFRRTLARAPDALALIDPSDCARVIGRGPRRLTYAEADRLIDALAAHFVEMRLPPEGIIALQLPNTVEFALTLLAAHRAGLVAALLPQLWRHADLTAALNYTGACALVTANRIDGIDHAALARRAGAETFSVRYIGAFGDDLPEGVTSLDAALTRTINATPPHLQDAQRTAAITFDTLADGMRAVPRSHIQLIAGALAIYLEVGIAHDASLLSSVSPLSFAGLTSGVGVWLLTGGALVLHHAFNGAALLRQLRDDACTALVVPGTLLPNLDSEVVKATPSLKHVIAHWRTPERIADAPAWPNAGVSVTDLYVLGEAGIFGARRGESGMPAMIRGGPFGAPRNDPNRSIMGETTITAAGTLGISGPMTAPAAYGSNGIVDTGCPARIDANTGLLSLDGAPQGLVSVGGYRFSRDHLTRWAERLGGDAALSDEADAFCGSRLQGHALSNTVARAALAELGLNPLISDAFRDHVDRGTAAPTW